ncbi:hypothetical protein [Novosphingobium soli]|uniref:Uncharacterized protein n=1 Tax=Novosphingobium soli TaxID=574956 RepID=A0ABV6D0K4_9SPHN
MNFVRPLVPPCASELLCFAMGGFVAVGSLAYLIWADFRGLVETTEVPSVWLLFLLAESPLVLLGVLFRYHRIRKLAALREYERVLLQLSKGVDDC